MRKMANSLVTRIAVAAACIGLMPCAQAAQQLFEGNGEGVPPEVERMYVKGLQFLVQTQGPDGNWTGADSYGSQPAVVALSMLAMMAHGDDPYSGPYSQGIKRGLDYLLKNQRSDNGYMEVPM